MRQLLERDWSRRRIATELGLSRHTVSRYLALGEWQPYSTANRSGQLDGHREWLQQQFEQPRRHHRPQGLGDLQLVAPLGAGPLGPGSLGCSATIR